MKLKVRNQRPLLVPDEVVECYSYGNCMWLALALHRNLGWPMEAIIDRAEEHIVHAWAVRPDGARIDILGPSGPGDFIQESAVIESLSESALSVITDGVDEEDVAEAWEVAQRYVLPHWAQ
jgi:hypothetical protein